jgi:hypothetical protein
LGKAAGSDLRSFYTKQEWQRRLLPSAPLNRMKGPSTNPLLLNGERNLCVPEHPLTHHLSPRARCTAVSHSCAKSAIRVRRSTVLSVPHTRSLGADPDYALENRGDTPPKFVERGYPYEPIITIPIPYIEVGMVMMLNKRVKSLRRGGAPLYLENLRN